MATQEPLLTGGKLNQAIANAMVRAHLQYVGRGPTRAQAFYRQNVVVVLLHDGLTTIERSLVADRGEKAVARVRSELQASMREAMVTAVEELTGCHVEAYLSAHSIEPDVASEVFVLDRTISDEPVAENEPARAVS
jgi:uncharacterized protein YbcI